MRKIKIRGLVHSAGWIVALWGSVSLLKGIWDAFIGEPEANFYSQEKWGFITRQQWVTWSGFEVMYGLACIALACLLFKYAARVPEYIER